MLLGVQPTNRGSNSGTIKIPTPVLKSFGTPVQWTPLAVSPEMETPIHETDHSPASNAEGKNEWSIFLLFVRSQLAQEQPFAPYTLSVKLSDLAL
jgi:hypothetical protein